MQRQAGGGGRPILRWAGGKSHLVPLLIQLLPRCWDRYVEPMVGGGALFFYLAPRRALLADVNDDLINFYRVLRDHNDRLIRALLRLEASRQHYYRLRAQRPTTSFRRAVRFAYLNRLSWNGLHRVNQDGEFNVPIGDRLPTSLWKADALRRGARALAAAKLIAAPFEDTLGHVRKRDFVFLDPPYPRGSRHLLGFNRYSPQRFELPDHKRLAAAVESLGDRGVNVMLTTSAASSVAAQYPSSLERHIITTTSLIGSSGASRRQVREMVLRNYTS